MCSSPDARGPARFLSLLLLTSILAAGVAAPGEDRRGNDDLFVMVDTSAPAGRALPDVKRLLEELTMRFARSGDRIVLMTFDSDARLRGVLPIVDRRRDGELLRDLIDGIDTTRVVRYGGTYPKLVESPAGADTGGGAWSDYCEMWRLTSNVLRRYREPGRRQSLLLVMASKPAAPPYRPCTEPAPPLDIAAAARDGGLATAVVALPHSADTAAAFAPHVADVLQMAVIPFTDRDRGGDGVRRAVLDALFSRLELVDPLTITLPPQAGEDVHFAVTVANHAHQARRLAILGATLAITGRPPIDVKVLPPAVTLNPGESRTLTLSARGALRSPGSYRGLLTFAFAPGSRFEPSALAFSATKLEWWETFGKIPLFGATAMTLLIAILVTASRRQRRKSLNKSK